MAPAAVAAAFIVEYCIVSSQSRKLRSQKSLTIPVGTSEVSSARCTGCTCMHKQASHKRGMYICMYICMYILP